MQTIPRSRQLDMTWLHEDPHWTDVCEHWPLGREYMVRRQAGQQCEVWETLGGVENVWGFTILWVPEESVFWAFNCGLPATWYYSPLTLESLLRELTDPAECLLGNCSELKAYYARSTRCVDCGGPLTCADWDRALAVEDGAPDYPQCATCFHRALTTDAD